MSVLKTHFPMIRDREDVIKEINKSPRLSAFFDKWSKKEREQFLDYCTGERGLKICYDPYFKEIFNVEYKKSRLDDLLSSIMGQRVEILCVLPNEGARIASENTLLITDILVRLENNNLVNVEIQKIGYAFPGERAACYSADLLLREYKRVRDKKEKSFKYNDIMPVYTIVIFEESPKELRTKTAKKYYIHKSETIFDTGIKINLLQKYIFISLDNFKDILHNRIETGKKDMSDGNKLGNWLNDEVPIDSSMQGKNLLHSRLEEWMMFLITDEPELIELLIRYRPYFKDLYADIYNMCLNTERLMNMYSKELAELDQNTIVYMMDELKAEIDSQKAEIDIQKAEIDRKDAEIERLKKLLKEKS